MQTEPDNAFQRKGWRDWPRWAKPRAGQAECSYLASTPGLSWVCLFAILIFLFKIIFGPFCVFQPGGTSVRRSPCTTQHSRILFASDGGFREHCCARARILDFAPAQFRFLQRLETRPGIPPYGIRSFTARVLNAFEIGRALVAINTAGYMELASGLHAHGPKDRLGSSAV